MRLADLLSMQQDNPDPSVQYSTGQPSLSSLTRGRTEEEINKLLSGMQMRTPGFDPNFMAGEPYMPPQAMPQNYVQRGNNAPIDMDQRQPMPQNYIQRGNNAPIDLGQSRRQHDVYADGPELLNRQQQPDGTFLVTKRVPARDGEGRMSSAVRQYIETPDYLNPAKLKEMQFKQAMQKLSEGNVDEQLKRVQLAELQSGKKATVPSGYRMTATGDLEPIPGGPADFKREGAFNADVASMSATESALNRLAEEANALKAAPGLGGITGIRGVLPDIPGTDAANARAKLDTLKSQVAFGTLQAMRDASKTGGALGAVSEKELKLLESNLAALGTAQSKEEFEKALSQIVKYTDEAKSRSRSAFNMKHQSGTGNAPKGAAVPVRSEEDAMRLPPGTKFILNGRTGVRE